MNFYPREREGIQIKEVDLNEVLGVVSGIRYNLFASQKQCQCCGLIGNRMFFEPVIDGTGDFHFNLYAETKYKEYDPVLVLMSCDHILPKRLGGTSDPSNLQTLCLPCNNLRELFVGREITNEVLRKSIPISGFIARATMSLRHTRTNLHKYIVRVEHTSKGIQTITNALETNPLAPKAVLRDKIAKLTGERDTLQRIIEQTLLHAQTNGIVLQELLDASVNNA